MAYKREEAFTASDVQIAFSKLSEKDQEVVKNQASRLRGRGKHYKKQVPIPRLGDLGALELLAAVGRLLNETD